MHLSAKLSVHPIIRFPPNRIFWLNYDDQELNGATSEGWMHSQARSVRVREKLNNWQASDSRTWPTCSGEAHQKKNQQPVSLLISEQLQPPLVDSVRSDPFLLLLTLSVWFFPRQHRIPQHGHESERAILGTQIKATRSEYTGTLMLPSARGTTACMHNYQINRNLKRHFL